MRNSILLILTSILVFFQLAAALDKEGTSTQNGLISEYFAQGNLTSSKFIQISKAVNFDWRSSSPLGGGTPNNYSIRLKGRISPRFSGIHNFKMLCDGGVRVMINDTIIINKWLNHTKEVKGSILLEKGKSYPILIEYADMSGQSVLKLFWSCPPNLSEEIVPSSAFLPKASENGLAATYFERENFGSEAAYTEIDGGFNLPKWKTPSPLSAIWSGKLEAPASGNYTFKATSNGDVVFALNNLNVLTQKTTVQADNSRIFEYSGSVPLLKDKKYKAMLSYSHKSGKPLLKIKWIPPSSSQEVSIPPETMYPEMTFSNTDRPVMSIDASDRAGQFKHFWNQCLGSCHAAIFLRPDMQEQVKTVKKELGIQYMRFHGILDDQVGIYSIVEGKPSYNWVKCDKIYDFLISQGIKPFVEFSFMPKAMASGDKKVFWYEACVSPPKNYNDWKELVRACVDHWKTRYGLEEIKTWRFEAWNEPNFGAFWGGSKLDYFKLYAVTAEAVKSVDPSLKVGGPASAGLGEWVNDFIAYCSSRNVPVDFVSTHGYPWDKGRVYDRDRDMDYPISKYFYYGMRETDNYAKQSGIPSLKEFHITEWGVNDYDKIQAAPFVCHTIKDAEGYVDMFSFWCISDIFEEMGPVQAREFPGIFGLLNVHGLKKATYNAFLLLNMLGDTKLNARFSRPDVRELEGWATTNSKDGSVQAMLWNFSTTDAPGSPWRNVTMRFKNLPLKKYRIVTYRVDNDHGNAYKVWTDMGMPEVMSPAQLQSAKEKTGLPPIGADRSLAETPNGSYGITWDIMPRDSIYFVSLIPVE